ncbi:MAG: hypothetical protein QOJ55_1458 [Solirubrobacteraceae bacterium]|nr:hypothetical protein [Solirubrobacteraceae bacterium]
MITGFAVERVEFVCPASHWRNVVDYDVVEYTAPGGDVWEYYSVDGVPAMSPYDIDGAPLCPRCGRPALGRQVARRVVPLPSGEEDRPRRRVAAARSGPSASEPT